MNAREHVMLTGVKTDYEDRSRRNKKGERYETRYRFTVILALAEPRIHLDDCFVKYHETTIDRV